MVAVVAVIVVEIVVVVVVVVEVVVVVVVVDTVDGGSVETLVETKLVGKVVTVMLQEKS